MECSDRGQSHIFSKNGEIEIKCYLMLIALRAVQQDMLHKTYILERIEVPGFGIEQFSFSGSCVRFSRFPMLLGHTALPHEIQFANELSLVGEEA